MTKLINYHDKSVGVKEIAVNVEKNEVIKKAALSIPVHVIGLSNEHGVDIAIPANECAFRKVMIDKGFSVARKADQQDGSIGLSLNMRKNKKEQSEKVVAAYLLYKNGKLSNSKGELIS